MSPIYATIVAEDKLLQVIAGRLLKEFDDKYKIHTSSFKRGYGEIDKNIKKWNQAAVNNQGAIVYFARHGFAGNPTKHIGVSRIFD